MNKEEEKEKGKYLRCTASLFWSPSISPIQKNRIPGSVWVRKAAAFDRCHPPKHLAHLSSSWLETTDENILEIEPRERERAEADIPYFHLSSRNLSRATFIHLLSLPPSPLPLSLYIQWAERLIKDAEFREIQSVTSSTLPSFSLS